MSAAGAVIAILYNYWLTAPVLHYVSIGKWRLVAIVVGVGMGALWALRVHLLPLAIASLAGLLVGGTWAAWHAPNDVRVTFIGIIASHLRAFWHDVLILTIAVTVGGICRSRLIGRGCH